MPHALPRVPLETRQLTLGHAQIPFELQRLLPLPLCLRPARPEPVELRLQARPFDLGVDEAAARAVQRRLRLFDLRRDRRRVRHSRAHPRDFVPQIAAMEVSEFLRAAQAFVAKHARKELRPLRRAERRHDRQFLLAREVGVEELGASHAEPALKELADRRGGVGDGLIGAVEIQLRHGQAANDAVSMPAELEIELHAHRRARRGAREPDGLLAAAGGIATVKRPRDRLEDRRLPRPVRTDDPREAKVELDGRVDVLPEVDHPEGVELHPSSSAPGALRTVTTCSASRR